jgi:DNA-binding CsgD family transcriptional regulator
MRYGPKPRALAQWRSMTSTATGRRDARAGTFVWTPSTGELRSCASLPSLLDLDADDDRPLLTRIVAHLHRDDIDRLHDVMRDVRCRGDAQSVDAGLSARELEVLELVAEGLSAAEIAARLVLSRETIRSHIRNVHAKLGVSDRVSAVVKAMRAGLIR